MAEGVALLERLDGHAGLRNALRRVAEEKSTWAGIPMPLEDERLIIEPTYPFAEGLMAMGMAQAKPDDEEHEFKGAKVRNSFWSVTRRSRIFMIEMPDGKITWGVVPGIHHLHQTLKTLGCTEAWGLQQEHKALDLLATLIPHRHFKQYLLAGCFLERSARSGVTYLFRKLKPTVAIVTHKVTQTRVLCALCMHPIGYYAGSWAGAMCPTDDVIAHLMLMRGDEPMFWKRCTQHPAWVPEAGL